jgi:hypothetical protein
MKGDPAESSIPVLQQRGNELLRLMTSPGSAGLCCIRAHVALNSGMFHRPGAAVSTRKCPSFVPITNKLL